MDEEDIESVSVVINPVILILLKEEAEEDQDLADLTVLVAEGEREITALREREEAHIRPKISTLTEVDPQDQKTQEAKTAEEAEIVEARKTARIEDLRA